MVVTDDVSHGFHCREKNTSSVSCYLSFLCNLPRYDNVIKSTTQTKITDFGYQMPLRLLGESMYIGKNEGLEQCVIWVSQGSFNCVA